MSIRENSEKIQIKMKPHFYKQINHQMDKKIQMIYDRYRTGKSITIDDLQYLWLKDPEGCEKLARSIVESKIGKELEIEPNNMVSNVNMKKNKESTNEHQNYIDYISSPDTPLDALKSVRETMISVKLTIEKMSERERMDMLNDFYDALELKKVTDIMKYWNDAFIDKIVTYSYDVEKEFDKLA